ncbi:M20 family metallopeptidase [Microbacterium sp. KRD172]|uniref:M20 family metallopeptidase n=1 Tax=Microbacterium sp. KRD172 TaxID=2729727 RepID=UPI0019D11F36|nr:M20/M25/M40 family metallo-hydrolase [Microbacterium sp. KRD172]
MPSSKENRDALVRLDKAIAEHASDAERLLVDLVGVPSVNPLQPGVAVGKYNGGESRANELFGEWLRDAGMETHVVEADPGRANLVGVRRGSGGGRSLGINAHIDTVAPQQGRFEDPWKAERVGNLLYGLGTTDMKAAHAAAWLAVKALNTTDVGLTGDLHIHSVVGEETMSHGIGTTAVLEAGFGVDAAIIPEPTSSDDELFRLANTAAGNYLFSLTVPGKSTHWASRNLAIRAGGGGDTVGVNAIDKAFYVYTAMRQLEDQWAFSKRHPQFPPGAFIIHPGVLHADIGFPAAPYFPDRARFDYLLSFPPGDTSEQIRTEVESHIHAAAALDPWLAEHPIEFEWIDTWPPAYTDPTSEFARVALSARNEVAVDLGTPALDTPQPNGAQSDASFYEAQGIPALVCGPGNLLVAHAADEYVDVDLIPAAARMLVRTALGWCSEG